MDYIFLGYAPGIFAKAIRALLVRYVKMTLVIDQINPNYTSEWWVRMSFQSALRSKVQR